MQKLQTCALIALFMLFGVTAAVSQTVKGKLVDADTNEPLIGASVIVNGTTVGVITDIDGNFSIKSSVSKPTIKMSYVGYKDQLMKIQKSGNVDLGTVLMKPDAVALNDVVVTSSIAVARKTPVALSTVDPVFIEEKLGTQEFPEILKTTPGVYATKNGGGYGDSKINMRGFQSANVAVMINGVPMNDMEWGGLYWSNWAGLSDVTRSLQTQRGLGASKVSAPSVGGSINIVTRTTDQKKGGNISYGVGNDGFNSLLFTVSTGLMSNGWAVTLLGGKKWGDGYIQGTEFDGYNYFLNVSKKLTDSQTLSLTAFGAPQSHNQRSNYDGLSIQGWQQVKNYMNGDSQYKYNPTYGFGLHGERKTSARNVYHKPQISLNHQWQINEKSSLSTSLYVSIGRGYGYSGQGLTSNDQNAWYGSSNGTLNTTFRNTDGTFAYDQIQEQNMASDHGSLMIMSKSLNYHNWYGLLSTYTTKLGKYLDVYGGVDFRYYKGIHKNEIIDLYDGKYYTDIRNRSSVLASNNSVASDPMWKYQKLGVGDVVYRDYDGFVMQEGAFGQAEYNRGKLAAFVAGSLSNTGYWRYDRFYYDKDHAKSDKLNYIGYTVKGGANFNLTENHNVFANIGYISRAPFFSGGAFLQSTTSNATNPDAINEKVFSAEVGYGYRSQYLTANLNVYYTKWMDKTTTRSGDIRGTTERYVLNMSGVDARHMGVELDMVAKPCKYVEFTGMLSVGDWKWDSNATGYFYNSNGQPLADVTTGKVASGILASDHAKFTINQKGVKVGGSAQTTAALGANFKPTSDLRFGLTYTYYANNYADYALSSSNISANTVLETPKPWKIPAAGQLDMDASYRFNIGNCKATLFGNVENLLNYNYIVDAYDGGTGTWDSAYRVFYQFGRTYSIRLKVNF